MTSSHMNWCLLIKLMLGTGLQVYCDLVTDGGGWTVIQRRDDYQPSRDFFLEWLDYKDGFGEPLRESWLGLDKIHFLTASQPNSLRIDLRDFEGNRRYATYSSFYVAN